MAIEPMLRFGRAVVVPPIVCITTLLAIATDSPANEILVPEDYRTIQAALDAAVEGDVISVAPRVYRENIRFISNGVTLRSRTRHGATIQGDGTTNVVTLNAVSGTVEGFVITGSDVFRAGVFTSQAEQVIRHNWIAGNYNGIAISSGSVARIEANHIVDNGPDFLQSAIRTATGASGTIVNNFIAGSGVGIWANDSTGAIEVINNSFVNNMNFGMNLELGGGVYSIRNNIISGSEYGIYAADGFHFDRSGYVAQFLQIDHNLLWNNSAFDYYACLCEYNTSGTGAANQGPFDPLPGSSEIYSDPLLDSVTGYELSADSPAIDAGDYDVCPETDLDGHLRPYDGNADGIADCDIGAVEYLPEPGIATTLIAGVVFLDLLHRRRARKLRHR